MNQSSAINHQERAELAELLTRHRQEVETRWLEKVGTELNRHGMSETELRDSIPDYLEAIARGLREESKNTMTKRGVNAWTAVARQHALTRIRLGFDIDEVMQEFMILRRVILEVLRERTELTIDQVERINNLIHGALRASVKSYVEHRDYESRREQAKHIGFITHELRNPLSTAMAAAGQVRKRGSPDLRPFLNLLEKNQKRLSTLIDDALLSQRLEVKEQESHPTEIPLGEIMEQALGSAEATARNKGVSFDVSFDPNLLLCVDLKLALSAVQNVIDNAAKFTDRGRVQVKVEDHPTEAIIHVFDDCAGLSQEELQTVFEPFKRGHSGKAGTGLGLAIARRAVEAHGKTIHAESSGEKGCHFWFALPKASH
jgi:signal transduction histidine kinase